MGLISRVSSRTYRDTKKTELKLSPAMPSVKVKHNHKTYVTPKRPYEKERLDTELKLIGEFGLKNKKEVWRVKLLLAKVRKAARNLLTFFMLEDKDPKRLFESNALLRRLVRVGVLDEQHMKLDYVLGLKIEDFMETTPDPSLQTRSCQIRPPRSSLDPTTTHPSPKTSCRCSILRR